jgi:ABC-2 type transport system permease protein
MEVKELIKDTATNIRFVFDYFKVNLSSQFEYRFSFIFTVLSMAFNDLVWIFFWFIIYSRFAEINGWYFKDLLLLYSIGMTSVGLTGVLFGHRFNMAAVIERGGLDFYLTLPKNVLLHLLVSKMSVGGFGDFIFGLVVAAFVLSWKQIPLFAFLCILSAGIIIAMAMIVGSLAFVLGRSESLERNLFMGILTFGVYPFSIFGGIPKLILLTIIPAGFITGIPVQILNEFSLKWLLIMIGVTILFLLIGIKMFYLCLKKYESGSIIVERM